MPYFGVPQWISGSQEKRHATGRPFDVPPKQDPKSRPPRNFRDRIPFFHGVLPMYSGPYGVGYMCLEVPAIHPRTFSNITRQGRHILQLETVLVSMYYPAAIGTGSGKDPAGRSNWSRETWLPHPRSHLAKGYGDFAGLPHWFAICWFFVTTWFTKLPSFRNATLANHWAPKGDSKASGWKIKDKRDTPPEGYPERPIFPLIMFSHGLGGSRTAYSSLCGEFASYGVVVCAIEHRDGTVPRTFINHTKQGLGSRQERETTGHVDHLDEEKRHSWDVQDFIFPKENPQDTSPNNERGVDYELRSAQIQMRLAEIEEAYQIVQKINDGAGAAIATTNLRNAEGMGASTRGLNGVDWDAWKGRVNMREATMVGHSFGAATTIELLRHAERFPWVSQGIMYDIWGMALKPTENQPHNRINKPLLGINSEAFMYWPDNFDAARLVCEEAQSQGAPAWLLTVRGTVHISQSDFPILYPHIAATVLNQTMDPRRAIDVNISASLEYLAKVLPSHPIYPFHRCFVDDENTDHFLVVPAISEMPEEHKPDEQWTAIRLKVPNEIKRRVIPKLRRRVKRYGGALGDNEIWMHVSPTTEGLKTLERRTATGESPSKLDKATSHTAEEPTAIEND